MDKIGFNSFCSHSNFAKGTAKYINRTVELALLQLAITCSKSTMEKYRAMCKICSKLIIKTPEQHQ